ncbi:MAG: PorV/PorQ family protein [Bacteroidia bacterium]
MIKHFKKIVCLSITTILLQSGNSVFAGNEDRSGQAGASQMLINPWARSSGWGGVNIASVRGVESIYLNVAGAAFVKKTEIAFTNTQYLKGSEISINSLGISQKVGSSSVISISIMSMSLGDIPITTEITPEGGTGTYSPQFINFGLSYSKEFSNSIYGGISVKSISESISDLKASGFAFDAGIMYITGNNENKDNLKFGISLKNVGAPMKYSGDGLSVKVASLSGNYQLTVEQRSEKFEIPSLVNIGISYDFELAANHKITAAADFVSNSFSSDNYGLGLEYTFKKLFSLRTGYVYENNLSDAEESLTVSNGISGGVTFEIPLGKTGKSFGIDYSYQTTRYFDGTHRIGARITL